MAAALGALYAIGFAVIGVDLALGVGSWPACSRWCPISAAPSRVTTATLLCILKFGVDWHVGAVIGWYAVCQTLEGFVLTPRIVGQSVGLHPAVVIVALLIGGDLFGFLGLLIAVPGAAVVKVFVDELQRRLPALVDLRGRRAAEPPADPFLTSDALPKLGDRFSRNDITPSLKSGRSKLSIISRIASRSALPSVSVRCW